MHNCIVCTCVASLYCGWVHVTFQVSSSTKRTSTFCTFVYFLPSVGDHVHPQWSWFTNCLLTFWASVNFHSTVDEQWACAFSDVQLDQMTCCIGHFTYGLSLLWVSMCISRCAARPNVLLQAEQMCIFFLCGWACAFSYVELYQMTYCIGHKHELFLCCGLPCDLSELLHDRITSGILNTCASCRSNLSRFWRGVRPLSLVIFVKLNDLKLSLSIAETCQAFNFVDRLLTLLLFFN